MILEMGLGENFDKCINVNEYMSCENAKLIANILTAATV